MSQAVCGSDESEDRELPVREETGGKEPDKNRAVLQKKNGGKEPEESKVEPQGETSGMRAEENRESIPLSECWDQPVEWVALRDAVGRFAGEFVNIYPPGTPVLVPGEKIQEGDRRLIGQYLADGLKVQGITMRDAQPTLAVLARV